MLGINLLAAHALRFKVTGRGSKLAAGVALIFAGAAIVWAVVQSGLDDTVESELSREFCNGLWHAMRATLGGTALALAFGLALTYGKSQQSASRWAWWFCAFAAAGMLALTVWLFWNPEAKLDPSGLRILWQLVKGTAASLVLWAGCWLVFGRRAGVVLLHGGIALMMFSELYTGLTEVETRMRLFTGETVSYAEDIRTSEFAIIDKSDPQTDRIVTIPQSLLVEAAQSEQPIEHPQLPLAIRVHQFLPNARVRSLQPGEQTPATAGAGLVKTAIPMDSAVGVSSEQAVDVPAAYVELIGDSGGSSGVLLASPYLPDGGTTVGGQPYEFELRFDRYHKPYSLTLLEFQHEKYVGAEKAKSFKSIVRLEDPEAGEDREVAIWMNNPLRYRGDGLYQSGFDPENSEYTELQVVSNRGWMIPYVACMIVATGMLVHFTGALGRFVRRREEDAARNKVALESTGNGQGPSMSFWQRLSLPRYWAPALIVAVFAMYVARKMRPPEIPPSEMQVYEFGELPIVSGGRVQPIDSFARNTLRQISDSEVVRLKETKDSWMGRTFGVPQKVPATQWLLDTAATAPGWRDYRIFRIYNHEILEIFDLKSRKGFRYSIGELQEGLQEFERQAALARKAYQQGEKSGTSVGRTQKDILELENKIVRVMMLIDAFDQSGIDFSSEQAMQASRMAFEARMARLEQTEAPRVVPPAKPDGPWMTSPQADLYEILAQIAPPEERRSNPAATLVQQLLAARRAGGAADFNRTLEEYQELVEERAEAEEAFHENLVQEEGLIGRKPAERLSIERLEFEALFNYVSPMTLCMALYIAAFVLATLGLLVWSDGFNRSANWLLWLTFAIHTAVLISRIYISGRPPVTNLHSSAVFIGWAAVLFALLFEIIYRMGIGNLLAPAIGFPTCLIAYYLAGDGDTFEVLQAVLDTQFWLATHVVCITLGYATTFLAGFLGIAYLVESSILRANSANDRRQLARMIYGTVCFSIFFSFVGTVLGGLWADDSWGRFWGWDPKENGALLIVLWNAIVLHARWGKMVRDRGLAGLAVFGNVVVAWSWFGVNQLGVGLHSYGETQGLWRWLSAFVISQMIVIALAWLPAKKTGGVNWSTFQSRRRVVIFSPYPEIDRT